MMRPLTKVSCWCVAAFFLIGWPALAGDVHLGALTQESQKVSPKAGEVTIVWWIPEEFWEVSLAQSGRVSAEEIEEFVKAMRPYTLVVVVDGTTGAFGGMTFKSQEWVRENMRLIDAKGESYAPFPDDKIETNTVTILQTMKPAIQNNLGPLGQNMHFFLFPGKTKAGEPIARAKEKGSFKVKLGEREFTWRLPLDSLLPAKFCKECQQECKGSWSFCPWCGKSLAKSE